MAEMDQDLGYGGTVGERLRRAREARGLSLEDVANQTRVPIRHLRSIEDSQWEDLPAVTYTVGFGRSYANAVGLDGTEVGRELREQLGDGVRGPQVSPTVYAPPDPSRVPSRSLAWVAGLLLVVLVAAYLIWRSQLGDGSGDAAQPVPANSEQQVQTAQPQPQAQPAPANLAGQPVTLVAVGDVWMNVTDRASGRRLFYNTLATGNRFQVPADAADPVIQTSNPQNLRVMIGDQDRGLLAPERRRVSNLSVRAADLAGAPQPGAAAPPAPR